jgi:hypothetical protein
MTTPDLSTKHPGREPKRPAQPRLPAGAARAATAAGNAGHTAPPDPNRHHHPALLAEQARRAEDAQLRIADRITAFAGSMNFVYLHIALFTIWMLFIESSPWP